MADTIRVGRGWKESEHPGELYVAFGRWTWCPLDDIAKLLFQEAVRMLQRRTP